MLVDPDGPIKTGTLGSHSLGYFSGTHPVQSHAHKRQDSERKGKISFVEGFACHHLVLCSTVCNGIMTWKEKQMSEHKNTKEPIY